MLRYVLDTLPFPWALRTLTQVADSAVGRWFRLEGSGHPREREGSRFMVSCLLSFQEHQELTPRTD